MTAPAAGFCEGPREGLLRLLFDSSVTSSSRTTTTTTTTTSVLYLLALVVAVICLISRIAIGISRRAGYDGMPGVRLF